MNTTARSNNATSPIQLDPLKIAIINNINDSRESDSIPRACNWFAERFPNVEIGEIPEDLKEFLAWLQPVNDRSINNWADAALNCIQSELTDQERARAISWLNQELAQRIGASPAIIQIASYLQPDEGPMNTWAECAFEYMFAIKDEAEKQTAINWLKARIATRIGNASAENIIQGWIRQRQPSATQQTVEPRVYDTEPCPPPAPSETDIRELKADPKPSKKGKKKETLQDVEQRIARLKREIRSQEAQLRDNTGGDEKELSTLQSQLIAAEAKRVKMLPGKQQKAA